MPDLQSILSLSRNKFDKFNNARAEMLNSIYHKTFKLQFEITFLACKSTNVRFYLSQDIKISL